MSSSASENRADSIPGAPKVGDVNENGFDSDTTIDPEDDPDTEYNVEGILAHKYEDGTEYYLLKWQGYGMHASSWEPVANLSEDLPEMWEAKKARIDAGEEPPFDIVDLYKAKYVHWMGRYARSRKRNARRAKLGRKRSSTDKKLHELCLEWKAVYNTALKERRKMITRKSDNSAKRIGSIDPETSNDEFSLFVADDNYQSTDLEQGNYDIEPGMLATPVPSGTEDPNMPVESPVESAVGTTSLPRKAVTSKETVDSLNGSSDTLKHAQGCEAPNEKSASDRSRETLSIAESTPSPRNLSPVAAPGPPRPPSRLPKVLMRPILSSAEAKLLSSSTKPSGPADSKAAGNIFVSGKLPQTRKRKASVSVSHETEDEGVDHRFADAASESRERRIFMKARRDRAPLQKLKLYDITGIGYNGFDIPTDMEGPRGSSNVIVDTNNQILSTSEPQMFHKTVRFTSAIETWDYESQHSTTPSDDNFRRIDSVPKHRLAMFPRPAFKINTVSLQQDTLLSVKKDISFQRLSTTASGPTPKPIDVTFSNVNATIVPEWFKAFESVTSISFAHQCTVHTFEMQSESLRVQRGNLSSGVVTSVSAPDALKNAANRLRVGSFCCISFQQRYSIVIYPLRCPLWAKSTEVQSPPNSTAADLGYFIFEMNYEAVPQTLNSSLKITHADLQGRKLLYDKILSFDYDKLLPISAAQPNTSHAFFVMFPESKVDIMSAFCNWLRDCDPKCRLLTSQQPGHFETFVREASCGTVIIHQSAIPLMRHMVGLYKVLCTKSSSINFWVFNEADQLFPLVPSYTEPGRRCSPAKVTLSPILQHGMAILLTPSFVLSKPNACITLLEWFKKATEHGGCHRLVVFNHIRELALELARGTRLQSFPTERKYRLWELLTEIMDPELDPYILNHSSTDELVVTAPSLIHEYDEQSLVNWFSVWAIMNLDRHREFIVIGTYDLKSAPSAIVSPVKFTAHAVSKPDAAYEIMTQVSALPSDTDDLLSLVSLPAPDRPPYAQRFSSTILPDNRGETIHKHLYHLTEKYADSLVFLYMYPVAYKNHEDGDRAGDPLCKYFATYSMWMQFGRLIGPITGHFRRVYTGVFYTPDFNSPDYDKSKPASVPRKAWIGMYRAVDSHTWPKSYFFGKRDFEIIIWDPNARFLPRKNLCLSHLDEAQQSFVEHVEKNIGQKMDGGKIMRVWLTGFMVPEEYHAMPLDATLVAMENVMENMAEFVPSIDIDLINAGYVEVKMDDVKDPDAAEDELYLDLAPQGPIAPSTDETLFTVVHPPPPIEPGRSMSECRNLFFDAVTEAQWKVGEYKQFEYTLQPTLSWYKVQSAESRDYGHLSVVPWYQTFSHLKILQKRPPQG